jgi:glycosyltransferase involved in cell wall biosynthesis
MAVELLVVDNGSSDDTPAVLQAQGFENLSYRWVRESKPGLAYARNTGLKHAKGNVLMFTDDDVRVPPDWISSLAKPILRGEVDAMAGGVRLAPHLRKPWMNDSNTGILAETKDIDPAAPERLVGANMAFHRKVLEAVPQFDPRLGAGALGMGEETLFSYQLREAVFTIGSAFDIEVEHHCDDTRFTAASLRNAWKAVGRAAGYIDYHWRHRTLSEASGSDVIPWLGWNIRLLKERVRARWAQNGGSPITRHEAYLLRTYYRQRQLAIESEGPRRYGYRGLRLRELT